MNESELVSRAAAEVKAASPAFVAMLRERTSRVLEGRPRFRVTREQFRESAQAADREHEGVRTFGAASRLEVGE